MLGTAAQHVSCFEGKDITGDVILFTNQAVYTCRAYRALEDMEEHPKLGKILVSFANPAKIVGERNQERKERRDGSGR